MCAPRCPAVDRSALEGHPCPCVAHTFAVGLRVSFGVVCHGVCVQISEFGDGSILRYGPAEPIADADKATKRICSAYPPEIQPPARTVMPLLGLLLCIVRIALPIVHTTYLYAIHPSKVNFLALQLAAISISVFISAVAIVRFFRAVPKIVKDPGQLQVYNAWLKRNLFEKSVRGTGGRIFFSWSSTRAVRRGGGSHPRTPLAGVELPCDCD